jgi:hypothetical protein
MSPEPTSTSAPLKKYRGSCHCGAEAPEITSSYLCDCSICRKRGYKCFEPEKFTVVRDDGKLTSYFFGNKNFDHQVCCAHFMGEDIWKTSQGTCWGSILVR